MISFYSYSGYGISSHPSVYGRFLNIYVLLIQINSMAITLFPDILKIQTVSPSEKIIKKWQTKKEKKDKRAKESRIL
jgi:hypothetical protein